MKRQRAGAAAAVPTSDKISHVKPRTNASIVCEENILSLYDDGWTVGEIARRLKLKIQIVKSIVLEQLERTA